MASFFLCWCRWWLCSIPLVGALQCDVVAWLGKGNVQEVMRRKWGRGCFTANSLGSSLATTVLEYASVFAYAPIHTVWLFKIHTKGLILQLFPSARTLHVAVSRYASSFLFPSFPSVPHPLPLLKNSQGVSDGRVPRSTQMEGCALKGPPKCGNQFEFVSGLWLYVLYCV